MARCRVALCLVLQLSATAAIRVLPSVPSSVPFRARYYPRVAEAPSLHLLRSGKAHGGLRRLAVAAATVGSASLIPSLALASTGAEHLHLGQKIALFFQQTGLPDWAVLALISATPAVELRGGVPVGNWMGYPPLLTFVICILGNMAPIAPTLLALRSPAVKVSRAWRLPPRLIQPARVVPYPIASYRAA